MKTVQTFRKCCCRLTISWIWNLEAVTPVSNTNASVYKMTQVPLHLLHKLQPLTITQKPQMDYWMQRCNTATETKSIHKETQNDHEDTYTTTKRHNDHTKLQKLKHKKSTKRLKTTTKRCKTTTETKKRHDEKKVNLKTCECTVISWHDCFVWKNRNRSKHNCQQQQYCNWKEHILNFKL